MQRQMFSTPLENFSVGSILLHELRLRPRQRPPDPHAGLWRKACRHAVQSLEDESPFNCLLSIQGSIEVFAAQAATPIEMELAQSMRAMSEEMMAQEPEPAPPAWRHGAPFHRAHPAAPPPLPAPAQDLIVLPPSSTLRPPRTQLPSPCAATLTARIARVSLGPTPLPKAKRRLWEA